MMRLSEIARRTGLPLRRIRYTLDHAVVAPERLFGGEEISQPGPGSRRELSVVGAFPVVLAAELLEFGMKRVITQRITEQVFDWASGGGSRSPLYDVFLAWVAAPQAELVIGGRQFLKIHVDRRKRRRAYTDRVFPPLPWTDVETGERQPDYRPVMTAALDLHELTRLLETPA